MNGKILTLRGVCRAGSNEKIMTFDSAAVGYGWRILDFKVMTNNNNATTDFTCSAALQTNDTLLTINDWDPNQTVGIANTSKENNESVMLDFNHVVVQNLFLSNYWSANVNYLVVLESMDIDPSQNIIYMLKERAQTHT